MSALLGRPLKTRFHCQLAVLLLACGVPAAVSGQTPAVTPDGYYSQQQHKPQPRNSHQSHQAELQPQQSLRFAAQQGAAQSVLATPGKLALPLGDSGGLGGRNRDASAFESYELPRVEPTSLNSGDCDDSICYSGCGDSTCTACGSSALFPNCTPPGLLQWMAAQHDASRACWTGQVDAVLFWRDAPPSRELAVAVPTIGGMPTSALNADQLNSEATGGPRIGIVRKDACGGAAEFIYLSAGSFRSQRSLQNVTGIQYFPSNLFGNSTQPFQQGTVDLGGSFQTFEANSLTPIGSGTLSFISGFRWFELQESFAMSTSQGSSRYDYGSSVVNSLYGGQIGLDAWLITLPWLKIDSWLKGGAYYNNAVQHTSYASTVPGEATFNNAVSGSPAAGSFVGEVGINGIVPVAASVNFRFGYTAFWLESIALATQQLSDQRVLATNGGTVLQGVNFGLEGIW